MSLDSRLLVLKSTELNRHSFSNFIVIPLHHRSTQKTNSITNKIKKKMFHVNLHINFYRLQDVPHIAYGNPQQWLRIEHPERYHNSTQSDDSSEIDLIYCPFIFREVRLLSLIRIRQTALRCAALWTLFIDKSSKSPPINTPRWALYTLTVELHFQPETIELHATHFMSFQWVTIFSCRNKMSSILFLMQ